MYNVKVGFNKHKRNISFKIKPDSQILTEFKGNNITSYKVEVCHTEVTQIFLHCDKHLNYHNNIYRLLILQVHMHYKWCLIYIWSYKYSRCVNMKMFFIFTNVPVTHVLTVTDTCAWQSCHILKPAERKKTLCGWMKIWADVYSLPCGP